MPACVFPGSSTAEHSAVNRRVASSNLARGAILSCLISWNSAEHSVSPKGWAAPQIRLLGEQSCRLWVGWRDLKQVAATAFLAAILSDDISKQTATFIGC
jgi:hypothetical protein